MKSPGKWPSNHVLVLERVVHLGERHRARLEPAVEHVLDPPHHRLARRDRRDWVGRGRRHRGGAGPSAARRNRARSRRASRRRRSAGRPGCPTSTPGSASPRSGCGRCSSRARSRASCRRCRRGYASGTQVMPWLSAHHAVPEGGDLHVPGRDRLVDQRLVGPPAMRIVVLIGLVADDVARAP